MALPAMADVSAPSISELSTSGNFLVKARIKANGAATTVTLSYGATPDYGATVSKSLPSVDGDEVVELTVPSQAGGATLHYNLVASSSAGTSQTGDSTVTFAAGFPGITVNPALFGADGSVTLSATVLQNGSATTALIEYGTSIAYDSQVTQVVSGTTLSQVVNALTFGKTYHYRITVRNSVGTTTTGDIAFKLEPAVLSKAATDIVAGSAKLNGSVTRYGQTGQAFFEWGLDTKYASTTPKVDLAQVDAEQPFSATILKLGPNLTYHFRLVVVYGTTSIRTESADHVLSTTDVAPTAVADSITLPDRAGLLIDVLKNDKVKATGGSLTLVSVTEPTAGMAVVSGRKILYTPGAGFVGTDSFSYTIADGFGLQASATVSVSGARAALNGARSAQVKDGSGNVVGTIRIDATAGGSFSARLVIDGVSYPIAGAFDAQGHFVGHAIHGATDLPVELNTELTSAGGTLSGTFGSYTASADLAAFPSATQATLAGRYTVELPETVSATTTATSTTTANTTRSGWATVRLDDNGEARIKGRTSDGAGFSLSAILSGTAEAPTLDIYSSGHKSTLAGTLTLADKITGSVIWSGDDGTQTLTLNGAPYVPPEKNQRALSTTDSAGKFATVTVEADGSGSVITHSLRFGKDNRVEVLDPTDDGFSLKFDSKTGTFRGKLRVDGENSSDREKISGVFLQNQSVGKGYATGQQNVRGVQISFTTPTTTPTIPAN